MAQLDLLALQRAIDGYGTSSSDSDEESAARDEEAKAATEAATKIAAAPLLAKKRATNNESPAAEETGSRHSESGEEDFDIEAVVAEGARRQQKTKHRRKDQTEKRGSGSADVVKPPQLPSPEAEIERMAAHVRGETERRLRQETRRLRQRPEEITHVSAGGDTCGSYEDAAHPLSRRERWRQKYRPSTHKETSQQVYVGLPIGKSWHVPLVGIEGKGGYRQSATSSQQKAAPTSAAGSDSVGSQGANSGKKRQALTIKEKEKLKRMKGQSSHATWKPELWMQLRQQYD